MSGIITIRPKTPKTLRNATVAENMRAPKRRTTPVIRPFMTQCRISVYRSWFMARLLVLCFLQLFCVVLLVMTNDTKSGDWQDFLAQIFAIGEAVPTREASFHYRSSQSTREQRSLQNGGSSNSKLKTHKMKRDRTPDEFLALLKLILPTQSQNTRGRRVQYTTWPVTACVS